MFLNNFEKTDPQYHEEIGFACCIISAAFFISCNNNQPGNKPVQPSASAQQAARQSVDNAVSCGTSGLAEADSILYMHGGGGDFQPTIPAVAKTAPPATGMKLIPGGEFSMGGINPSGMKDGGHEKMDDARPVHRVYIDPFYMDETEVTNAQFAAFVKATGYKTIAEQKPDPKEFPGVPKEKLLAGSIVFTPPPTKVQITDYSQWWSYMPGADWKHPSGPNSSIEGKENYPVVQITWEDAAAYAKWAGKRLPTEAEWEFAARGGESGRLYTWGNTFKPADKWMANIFQGSFPDHDIGSDGFTGLAPVKQFPSNPYGLYDMAGNCWEWCADWYDAEYYKQGVVKNPKGPVLSNNPTEPAAEKKVQRGGSFLCTGQYCTRYMVGTRGKGEWRSGANHVGFRCVKDVKL